MIHRMWIQNVWIRPMDGYDAHTYALYILLLFSVSILYPQTRDVITERHTNGMKKVILVYKGEGRNEEVVEKIQYYDNGQMNFIIEMKNGKPDGRIEGWYEKGQKRIKGTFNDEGHLDGFWIEWYDNGKKKIEGTYKDGKEDGLWTKWYENGQKEGEGTYKDGERDGEWIEWSEVGIITKKTHYTNGEYDGNETYYYPNGDIRIMVKTENNLSVLEEYFKDGKTKTRLSVLNEHSYLLVSSPVEPFMNWEELFHHGVIEGEWKIEDIDQIKGSLLTNFVGEKLIGEYLIHYENGNPKIQRHYDSEGNEDGLRIEWHENGNKKTEGSYRGGEKYGKWITWFKNGNKKDGGNYVNGGKSGLWIQWWETGEKSGEGEYRNKQRFGEWTYYKKDGSIRKTINWSEVYKED